MSFQLTCSKKKKKEKRKISTHTARWSWRASSRRGRRSCRARRRRRSSRCRASGWPWWWPGRRPWGVAVDSAPEADRRSSRSTLLSPWARPRTWGPPADPRPRCGRPDSRRSKPRRRTAAGSRSHGHLRSLKDRGEVHWIFTGGALIRHVLLCSFASARKLATRKFMIHRVVYYFSVLILDFFSPCFWDGRKKSVVEALGAPSKYCEKTTKIKTSRV